MSDPPVKARRVDLYFDEFLAGIAGRLSPEQLGVYWVMLLLIYSAGGPVEEDHRRIAQLFRGVRSDAVRHRIDELVQMGKLVRYPHGEQGHLVGSKRAQSALEEATKRISRARLNGQLYGHLGGRPPNNSTTSETHHGSSNEKTTSPPPTPTPPERAAQKPNGHAKRPQRTTKPRTPMTPDWQPTQADIDLAKSLNLDIVLVLDMFRDHYIGNGERRPDWNASFKNWCRRERSGNVKPQQNKTPWML